MTTALAEREPAALAPTVTDAQLDLVRKTVANGATADELKLYLYDCQRQGVHPLDRLLHFTKRGGKYTPVTSIDLMRTRAADTGEYAGSDDAIFVEENEAPGKPLFIVSATVTVWRLVGGMRCAFTATARMAEYCPGQGQDHMWRKMPHTMLGKCAEALALRKGFPRQLAGLYAREELDQANGSDHPAPDSPNHERMPRAIVGDQSASVPNAGVSGDSFDPDTGEIHDALPPGFHRIADYQLNGQWHEARLLNWDNQGGALRISTKLEKVGFALAQAFTDGVAISADVTMKKNGRGEAYLNKFERLTTTPRVVDETHGEPVNLDDIPFGIALALLTLGAQWI